MCRGWQRMQSVKHVSLSCYRNCYSRSREQSPRSQAAKVTDHIARETHPSGLGRQHFGRSRFEPGLLVILDGVESGLATPASFSSCGFGPRPPSGQAANSGASIRNSRSLLTGFHAWVPVSRVSPVTERIAGRLDAHDDEMRFLLRHQTDGGRRRHPTRHLHRVNSRRRGPQPGSGHAAAIRRLRQAPRYVRDGFRRRHDPVHRRAPLPSQRHPVGHRINTPGRFAASFRRTKIVQRDKVQRRMGNPAHCGSRGPG